MVREHGRGQLHTEPHMQSISYHVTALPWQDPEEELNKLLLTKVSDRDRNVKVKIFVRLSQKYFVYEFVYV